MPVPEEDIVCRFVRSKDWSTLERRPKAGAFKGKGVDLSVWHPARLQAYGAQLEDLQFGPLAGTGQAHYTAGGFGRIASKVEAEAQGRCETGRLDVIVEWSPDQVAEEWKRWAYAHIDIRTQTDCQELGIAFRRALCFTAQHLIPPPLEADPESTSP